MVTAAWDTSNLVALYKDNKQCTSCCAPEEGDPDYRLAGICSECFAAGRTPQFVTVIFVGIEDCPGKFGDATIFNKAWKLERVECLSTGDQEWRYEDDDVIVSARKNTTSPFSHVIDCTFKDGILRLQPFGAIRGAGCSEGWCCGVYTNLWTGPSACLFAWGFNGTATLWPLWWEPWLTGTPYLVDKMVSHGEVGYECTAAHTSSTGTEPGVGVGWETVWSLRSDPCDDEDMCG